MKKGANTQAHIRVRATAHLLYVHTYVYPLCRMSKLRLHKRFIFVGVDVSIYALLIGGRSSYPPVLDLYCTHVRYFSECWLLVCVCVLPSARPCAVRDDNNKDDVCTRTIPAGLKCPPSSNTISLITWFEAYLNTLSVFGRTLLLYFR